MGRKMRNTTVENGTIKPMSEETLKLSRAYVRRIKRQATAGREATPRQ